MLCICTHLQEDDMRLGCNNVHVHLLTIPTKLASCVHEQKHGLQWAQLMGTAMLANKKMLFMILVDCTK